MNITLVSHASVIIETHGIGLWTDPWILGKAFNDSWTLLGDVYYKEELLRNVTHIWISHEHPDHFHVHSLMSLPKYFKDRVVVMFQKKNSEKLFAALGKVGFKNFKALENRRKTFLNEKVWVYCYQAHFDDSALGISDGEKSVFDVNDAEIDTWESRTIKKQFGKIDIALNQFSIAGDHGYADYESFLPKYAQEKLERIVRNHRDFSAGLTIPFASFVYFSTEDNKHVNRFANTPETIDKVMRQNSAKTLFLYPGDTYTVGDESQAARLNEAALSKWQALFKRIDELEYSAPPLVSLEKIKESFEGFVDNLRRKFPRFFLNFADELTFFVVDHRKVIRFSFRDKIFQVLDEKPENAHIFVYSQPLWYSFHYPWGFETLNVSCRVGVRKHYSRYKTIKNLSMLNNHQIYLNFRDLIKPANFQYIFERVKGNLVRQLLRKAQSNSRIRSQAKNGKLTSALK